MIKIAIATKKLKNLKDIEDLLSNTYEFSKYNERQQDDLYVLEANLKNTKQEAIDEMFQLIETITGIDVRTRIGNTNSKKRHVVRAFRTVCYLLHYRFGMSHPLVAKMLNYRSHASSLLYCHQVGKIDVSDKVIIEIAIRNVLNVKILDKRRGRTRNEKEIAKEMVK